MSLCETPDLDIVPGRFAVRRGMVFLAGLELPALHLGLGAAGMLVRLGVMRSLVPFAGVARGLAGLLQPFGTDRGGMLVEAEGRDARGQRVRAGWSLVAEGGDGPAIPTLAGVGAVAPARRGAGAGTGRAGLRGGACAFGDRGGDAAVLHRYAAHGGGAGPGAVRAGIGGRDGGAAGGRAGVARGYEVWAAYAGTASVEAPVGWVARLVAGAVGFSAAQWDGAGPGHGGGGRHGRNVDAVVRPAAVPQPHDVRGAGRRGGRVVRACSGSASR